MKILQQDNIGSHYRSAIYKLMDQELNCDFCFGDKLDDIKKMDYSVLSHKVKEVHNKQFRGGFYYQKGILQFLREDYDIYIFIGDTRCISTWLFCVLVRLFYPEKTVYFWSHGWYGKETYFERLIKKFFFKLPKGGCFLYGKHARDLMIKEGFSPNKLYVIHNSLDYDTQLSLRESLQIKPIYYEHFSNSYNNIVFIGRLTKVKRFDLLLEAIAILKLRGEIVNIIFIGDGVERQNMENMAINKGIISQVWFYGASYDEKTNAELIYNADLCVSPGNIGLTAIHVMMFGCPAITNDDFKHQMPEYEAILEGLTGSFFRANDCKSLADTISRWFVEHSDDREQVRRNCYKEIDNEWNPHMQVALIKQVLGL